jgi:hypothetical protein
MSLDELYAGYLRQAGSFDITAPLTDAGLVTEAALWRAWRDGVRTTSVGAGPWAGRQAHLGSRPPPLSGVGDLWFDVCELMPMIHVGRAWLATRPVAAWQVSGFLAVAERAGREVQVSPPYVPLDRGRLGGPAAARQTRISEGEATLYAWWFGKLLPHLFDWQSAEESLPGSAMRELWRDSAREWTSNRLADDESARVFVTPSTIQWDPGDVLEDELGRPEGRRSMIRGEYTRDPDIGFRTAVLIQTGILERVSAWHGIPEPVRLVTLIDRSAFG